MNLYHASTGYTGHPLAADAEAVAAVMRMVIAAVGNTAPYLN